ncbi:MAG TPA: hypothetical protein DEB63_03355 [Agrobacterium sp.]|nr:hypothetical protein [Agrobacterium sp.]
MQTCAVRMPDLHKKELFRAQKSTISHSADAHGGFSSQFHRISCSPLEVFDLQTCQAAEKSSGLLFWKPQGGNRPAFTDT